MKSLQQIIEPNAERGIRKAERSALRVPRSAFKLALACILAAPLAAAASTISLTDAQRAKLSAFVESEPEAAKQFRYLQRKADAVVNEPGRPIARIQSAGRLGSDPLKKESADSLEDMKKLHALGYAAAVAGVRERPNAERGIRNAEYSEFPVPRSAFNGSAFGRSPTPPLPRSPAPYTAAVRRIILRWAEVNQPTGQPIDETKLEPLFTAYDLTRAAFPTDERKMVDAWLRRIALAELDGIRAKSATATNNWQSHRLKIAGLIGFLLDDRDLIDRAIRGFQQQIADNLRPDGSSFDFHQRDSLHYHCYTLEPLLALAVAARQYGIDLYGHQAPNGASLSNSVSFLVPYCEGSKTHAEFVHTRVRFDRARAEAGEKAYAPGKPFNPREARGVFDLAAFFDDRFQSTALRLHGGGAAKFPNWQSVLNKVRK